MPNTLHDWAVRRNLPASALQGVEHPVYFGRVPIDRKELVVSPVGGPSWIHELIREELSK